MSINKNKKKTLNCVFIVFLRYTFSNSAAYLCAIQFIYRKVTYAFTRD